MKAHPTIDPQIGNPTVTALNKLIETNKDAEKGYSTAARTLRNKHPELAQRMEAHAQQRATFANALADAVLALDARPEKEGNFSAGIYRGWIRLRNVLRTGKTQAILREVERGERLALHNYDDALTEGIFDDATEQIVRSQRDKIAQAHDSIRNHLN
ncbi:MAG: ferritin-like domain-containing protein [Anaerolineales bacterium]